MFWIDSNLILCALEKSLDRLFATLQNYVSCPLTRLTNVKNVWHGTDGAGCIFLRISNRGLWQSLYILRYVKLKRSLVHRYWIIQCLRSKLLLSLLRLDGHRVPFRTEMLCTVLMRREPHLFLEYLDKVTLRWKRQIVGDVYDIVIGVLQKVFGLLNF